MKVYFQNCGNNYETVYAIDCATFAEMRERCPRICSNLAKRFGANVVACYRSYTFADDEGLFETTYEIMRNESSELLPYGGSVSDQDF